MEHGLLQQEVGDEELETLDFCLQLAELARLIVATLNLEMSPTEIDPEAPLYGEGLGLDSIDILEVALIVSKRYGVQLRADSQENHKIFRSLRHLAEYIAAQRTK